MAYEVALSAFQGPLDLLLHLIEKAELDIKDIFISQITQQYLAYMGQVDALDMDTASEFLSMAATLLYIKSRSLLPRPPREGEPEEEDPALLLITQLREYKAFKQASVQLEECFKRADGRFTKLPDELLTGEPQVQWDSGVPEELYAAFCRLLQRTREDATARPLQQVQGERYTVRRESRRLRQLLRQQPTLRFEELFEAGAPRLQMIVVFMALLEMISRGEAAMRQSAPFAPITIVAQALVRDDAQLNYMDEEEDAEQTNANA